MMKGMRVWQTLLMFSWAGWVNQEPLKVIDYLQDENRTLRKLIKKQPIRLSLEDRRRLAVKGRAIGRKTLEEVATIARADTILGWFRELVAEKRTFPHHLRSTITQYLIHYHQERNHQGLDNRLIVPEAFNSTGQIRRRKRIGGLLNHYYREAA